MGIWIRYHMKTDMQNILQLINGIYIVDGPQGVLKYQGLIKQPNRSYSLNAMTVHGQSHIMETGYNKNDHREGASFFKKRGMAGFGAGV